MQILIIDTREPTLRSEAIGWSYEDTTYIDPDVKKPIGLSGNYPAYHVYNFPTVIHALKHGYNIFTPPTQNEIKKPGPGGMRGSVFTYTWLLTKNETVR